MTDSHAKLKPARIEGWVAIISNTLLFGLKLWAGLTVGSVAILADAWHTFSDSLSSVILLIGAKVAGRPPDREHPFGYGRTELMVAFIIGLMLAAISLEFLYQGINLLRNPRITTYGTIGLTVTAISVVVKELMAQFAFFLARRSKLKSLRADAWHHRSDAFSSLVLLIGILCGGSWPYLDGLLTLLIAFIIAYAAFGVIRDVWKQLLGAPLPAEQIEEIAAICREEADCHLEAYHFHLHDYGLHSALTFRMRLDGNCPLTTASGYTRRIDLAIRRKFGFFSTIHLEVLPAPEEAVSPDGAV